jgi:hypothetical protein
MKPPPRFADEIRLEKEPLVTGHSGRADLIERCRIEHGEVGFLHGIPVYIQAGIYLLVLIGLLVGISWMWGH